MISGDTSWKENWRMLDFHFTNWLLPFEVLFLFYFFFLFWFCFERQHFSKFHLFMLSTKTASIACQRPPPKILKPQKFEFDSYGSIFARTLEQCGKSVAFYMSTFLILLNIPPTCICIRAFGLYFIASTSSLGSLGNDNTKSFLA